MKQLKNILIFTLFMPINVNAQDYKEQIEVFAKSFDMKDTTIINKYLSPELKFDPIPMESTPAIMNNIITQFPKLKDFEILEMEKGKAKLAYNFSQLGKSESYLFFDEDGKINRIELIENLIQQQLAEQERMAKSVKVPDLTMKNENPPKEVSFKASDGLVISGDLYEIDAKKPVILLCHQAEYNRIEYADIAPQLNAMGYNCLAIDQRSGGSFAEVENQTAKLAETGSEKRPTMLEVQQDLDAAVAYLSEKYGQKIILWGSSYSAALSVHVGSSNDQVSAVIAFSPGDYFETKRPELKTVFSEIQVPYFITSSKTESTNVKSFFEEVKLDAKHVHFIPESEGFHGSRTLWKGQEGSEEYWNAIKVFLKEIK